MCHFSRPWNGTFDRHQAEITVMQFTGHSPPVHQFVGFLPCPILSAKLAYANGICTSAVFGMACLVGSEVNIQYSSQHLSEFLRLSLIIFSFRVFRLLSSSLLIYSQRFGQYVHQLSSSVSCRTREPTRNFEPCPFFNARGSFARIPFIITRCKC